MTNTLHALLEAPKETPTKDIFVPRLDATFTVRGLKADEFSVATAGCKNQNEVFAAMVAEATEGKPFHNGELLARYEATTPRQCVGNALYAGELTELAAAVSELSGFDNAEVAK